MAESIWGERAATRSSRAVTGATRRTSAGVDAERGCETRKGQRALSAINWLIKSARCVWVLLARAPYHTAEVYTKLVEYGFLRGSASRHYIRDPVQSSEVR